MSAAAYRRKKSDFVAGIERRAPCGEFLISRGYDRAAIGCKLRLARDEGAEKILDARPGCEFDKLLRSAGDLFESAEKEDFHPDGCCYVRGCHAARMGNCNPQRNPRPALAAVRMFLEPSVQAYTA